MKLNQLINKMVLAFILVGLLVLSPGCGTLKGAPGQNGLKGPQGAQGEAGAVGPRGEPGRDGIDASGVTVVQLCRSCTPMYPSVFAEIGFCINNKLYGTYSANGGFSAYLPVGGYISNGIGCTCTFTITSGCNVVQQ